MGQEQNFELRVHCKDLVGGKNDAVQPWFFPFHFHTCGYINQCRREFSGGEPVAVFRFGKNLTCTKACSRCMARTRSTKGPITYVLTSVQFSAPPLDRKFPSARVSAIQTGTSPLLGTGRDTAGNFPTVGPRHKGRIDWSLVSVTRFHSG